MTTTPPAESLRARPSVSFEMRAKVRLFHTEQPVPCREDPELFFDPHQKNRAIRRCADCPFLARCGFNAVALGATHGVWGGMILPGAYPPQLQRVYARLAGQFEQLGRGELGDVALAALADLLTESAPLADESAQPGAA